MSASRRSVPPNLTSEPLPEREGGELRESGERRVIAPVRSVQSSLAELRQRQGQHPFWHNRLLVGLSAGAFTREDLRYVFSQYHLYSKNFTRFIAAVMANCESDLFRAQLSENLWEEGGGCEPEKRHAELFRTFLRESLQIDRPEEIAYATYTRYFVREYLVQCLRAEPMAGSAFLSLGTEGIVARLYGVLLEGLRKAGIPDSELTFFHLHIECDDEHAVTLERMMASYAEQPRWFDTCLNAMNLALELRNEFFDNIFDALQQRRLEPVLARMQARRSLAVGVDASSLRHRPGDTPTPLYSNVIERHNIQFSVDRLPLAAEVLDPRMVRIPPGKFNERHRHAHETLIHFLDGTGRVLIDDAPIDVQAGDSVLVPRWAMHQTQNLGATEMRFLAVTDFSFTERAYVGDAHAYRQRDEPK